MNSCEPALLTQAKLELRVGRGRDYQTLKRLWLQDIRRQRKAVGFIPWIGQDLVLNLEEIKRFGKIIKSEAFIELLSRQRKLRQSRNEKLNLLEEQIFENYNLEEIKRLAKSLQDRLELLEYFSRQRSCITL